MGSDGDDGRGLDGDDESCLESVYSQGDGPFHFYGSKGRVATLPRCIRAVFMADFRELDQFEPHQVLRDRGKLLVYEENGHVAEGPIFFLSHQ